MKTESNVTVEDRRFPVSNLEKILWPEKALTKGDLIYYYVMMAPYIIEHLKARPMVFTRYPEGVGGKYFYQKDAPPYTPEWINTFPWYSRESQRTIKFLLIEEPATLAWLANQACIEMHPWLSRIDKTDYPDFIVFDLDPPAGVIYQDVVNIALAFKNLFSQLNLRTYLKTSGSLGLHIYLPVINRYDYRTVRIFARKIVQTVHSIMPNITTMERRVSKRGEKVYLDYLQNARGKTLCSVYSVRARPEATVSTPLLWEEAAYCIPEDFNIKTIIPRLKEKGDLFQKVLTDRQALEKTFQQLKLRFT